MPRRLDHLVICVHNLAKSALDWQKLGFTLTPTGIHPFGTSNRLAMFGNNFLELLAVTDAQAVLPPTQGHFSFAAHNQDFLRGGERDVDARLAQQRLPCRSSALSRS